VFDVLQIGTRDTRPLPLAERKRLLGRLVPDKGVVRVLDHVEGRGSALFALCKQQRLEGVIAKRKGAPYRPGPRRYDDWVKIKTEREGDFVVVAWIPGKGSRTALGALEVASWDGRGFVRRGRVGSGLDDASIRVLLERLRPLEVPEPTAEGKLSRERDPRRHVRPEVVVSVQYLGFTDEGSLRHPVFHGLKDDVAPTACTSAPAEDLLEPTPEDNATLGARAAASERVAITNREKIFWPDEGYTKGELIEYYAGISEVMLPYLRERPIALVRYPDGIAGKSFYQWNVPPGTPEWIETHRFRDEEGKSGKHTFIVNDVEGLLHIANLGCIPIHILACRRRTEEQCDFLTIDFDVGRRSFRDAVVLALSLRELLDELGLTGYPKTSGQSGLHVLVPLGPGVSFETAKMLTELMGRVVQMKHPDLSTMERRVSERGERVYIDTGQTGRSRTIVAPYSVRATRGATVSTPLDWQDVHLALDPAQFTMFTVAARVAERGDPMEALLAARPDVPAAVVRLGAKLGR
jgi:bifunctional non-homologous end joining protein LigD